MTKCYHMLLLTIISILLATVELFPDETDTSEVQQPGIPVPVSPLNNSIQQSLNIFLIWNAVDSVTGYHVQLSTDSLFSQLYTDDSSLTDTVKNVNGLSYSTIYYWRIKALNDTSESSWSATQNFRTLDSLLTPSPLSPLNNSTNQNLSITLNWSSVVSASKYHVQLSLDSLFTQVSDDDSNLTETVKNINGLSNSTTYYWRIKALSDLQESPWSPVQNFRTVDNLLTPVAVSPVNNAANQNINLTLTWNSVGGAANYYVQLSKNNTFTQLVVDDSLLTDTVRNISGLLSGTDYFWRVKAKNSTQQSPFSSTLTFKTLDSLITPVPVSPVNNATNQDINITLKWNSVGGAANYYVQLSKNNTFTQLVVDDSLLTDTVRNVSGLLYGTDYFWRVKAKNSTQQSPFSSTLTFKTLDSLITPVPVSPVNNATNQDINITLKWNSVGGAANYYVQLSKNNTFTQLVVDDSLLTDTVRNISGLLYGTDYFWRIQAKSSTQQSPFSSSLTFKTLDSLITPVPISPVNNATNQDINITLKWNSVGGAANYYVQLSKNNTFTQLVVDDSLLTDTVRNVSGLLYGTNYFWRIKAKNSTQQSPFSSILTFKTLDSLITPLPVSPANNSLNQNINITLKWNSVGGAANYYVQLSKNNTFTQLVVNDSLLTDTVRNVSGLLYSTNYFWRIKAKNSSQQSPFSSILTFKTLDSLITPVPVSPANNTTNQDINITLKWNSIGGAANYYVQLSKNNTFTQLVVNDSLLTDTVRNVSGLLYSTNYFWRIKAKNSSQQSPFSSILTFKTLDSLITPVPVSPANNSLNQNINITLKWNSVGGAANYYVQLSKNNTFTQLVVNDSLLTDTVRNVSGLLYGTNYFWRIKAKNSSQQSPFSSILTFKTLDSLITPVPVSPANNSLNQNINITLKWNSVGGAANYYVQLSKNNTFTQLVVNDSLLTDTVRNVSGLLYSTNYFWRIKARNSTQESPFSSILTFKTLDTLLTPIPVSPVNNASNQNLSLTLKWTSVVGAVNYYVQLSSNNLFTQLIVNDSLLTDTVKNITGLLNSTTYYWRVKAKNSTRQSPFSSIMNFKTLDNVTGPLTVPVAAAPLNNSINQNLNLILIWNSVVSATRYQVQLSRDNLFSQLVVNDSLLTDTVRNVNSLLFSTTYYWRIKAKNTTQESQWSATQNFKTLDNNNTPVIVSPLNNSVIPDLDPTLKWNSVASATRYHVQLSTDSIFTQIITNDSLRTDTLRNISSLAYSTTYYWRVRAIINLQSGPWSAAFNFKTLPPGANAEGGYASKLSVKIGDPISFFISTSVPSYSLSFYRSEDQRNLVASYPQLTGGLQVVPDSSYRYGCGWQESFRLIIPNNWLPGAYTASFPVKDGTSEIIFYVTQKTPGSFAKTLYVSNINTWHAYNNFGGKSLYSFNSTNNENAPKISFLRPNSYDLGYLEFDQNEELFIKWAFRNNIPLEYASNYDVYANPDLLSHYSVVVTSGHSEYWSRQERLQFQNFISNGGKVAFLSGNTCWWQVRYEDNGNTLVCYKLAATDPLSGVADSLVTVNWDDPPLNLPENIFTGASYAEGGYINSNGVFLAKDGYSDYAAFNTHHWMYKGTGIIEGQEFGYNNAIVGYEVDGSVINWQNGIPVVTGSHSTPLNFRILGLSPASHGHATMGIYHNTRGGAVFNASTISWSLGLVDPAISRMTKNIFDKFLANRFPPEILSWSPAIVNTATINNESDFINLRQINMEQGSSLPFSLVVNDPYNETVHYIWQVNGIETGRNPVYTFQNNQGLSQYTITAFVYNSHDTTSISWAVTNLNVALRQPVLVQPANNQQNINGNPVFKWMKTDKADRYVFQLSIDLAFNTILYTDSLSSDTVRALQSLQTGSTYYWRVKAVNSQDESQWSYVSSFKTIGSPDTIGVTNITLNLINATLSGDARLGTMGGSINTRVAYFQGLNGGASFNVTLPASTRNWYIWGRMYYNSSGGKNSFFVTMNGNRMVLGDDDTKYNQWNWDGNNGGKINMGIMSAGQKTILISGREPGLTLWVDQIIVTDDPNFFPPGFILKTINSINLPSVPALNSPSTDIISGSAQATLKWKKASGATNYIVHLSDNVNFTNIVFSDSSITDTFRVVSSLGFGTKYYWRVKSKNSNGTSDWSSVFSFTITNTDTTPTTKFVLNAMNGTFSGDARLGTKSGSINTRSAYFKGPVPGLTFNINIPASTRHWYIWGRMYYMSSGGKNSFFVTMNGNTFVLGDDDTKYDQWNWDGNNGGKIDIGTMTAGQHSLVVYGREPGLTLWIDQLILTDDPDFLPDGFVLKNGPVPPDVAALAAPANNAVNQPLQLALKWRKANNATKYYLHLSKDSTFSNILISDSALTDTTKSITSLEYSTKYYWRVKSLNASSEAAWSNISHFTTLSDPDTLAKTKFVINAMDGIFSGDARLGTKSGSINTRSAYFKGPVPGLTFNINIPASTRHWYIWGRMYYTSSGNKNSFFVTMNGNTFVLGDDDTKYDQWNWDGNNGGKIDIGTMTAGQHSLVVYGREPGLTLWIDQLILTDDPDFLPDGFVLKNNGPVLPDIALLASPADNAVNQAQQLTLKWKKANNASKYYLHLSKDSAFSTILVNDSSLVDTIKNISSLVYSTKYFWRVKSVNASGEAQWSNVSRFTTTSDPDTLPKTRIILNAMSGIFSGDARLGTKSGSINTRAVYFQGLNGGVTFTINIPSSPRKWFVWGRIYSMSSGGKNSFYITVGGNKQVIGDNDSKYDQWYWDGTNGTKINLGVLTAGQKTVLISGKEPGLTLWIDQVIITDDSLLNPNVSLAKRSIDNEITVSDVPVEYTMTQNFPNPFNPQTRIRYSVPEDAHVVLKVYNILGQEIKTLVDEVKSSGFYEVSFDGSNLASGVYIYQIRAKDYIKNMKFNLLK